VADRAFSAAILPRDAHADIARSMDDPFSGFGSLRHRRSRLVNGSRRGSADPRAPMAAAV
jgi:hypothetical protein